MIERTQMNEGGGLLAKPKVGFRTTHTLSVLAAYRLIMQQFQQRNVDRETSEWL